LEVRSVAGRSAAISAWAVNPLKWLVPRSRGPSVWAYLCSFGGGLVAGDETELRVRLGEEARCYFGTQASTKVYRSPKGRKAVQELTADLDSKS
jgi:urease accessory protein